MRFNYNKAAQKVSNALQAASVVGPAGAEFLLGSEVVNGERPLMTVIYIGLFVLFNFLAAVAAGFETERDDDSG